MEKGTEQGLGYWNTVGHEGNYIQRDNDPTQAPDKIIMKYNRIIAWKQ